MTLYSKTIGESGSPVVFCHGLFGQGKNWTQIAKALADDHRSVLLDMPNHGRSEWTERFDYIEAAEIVADSIPGPCTLVGHSMGAKIAMLVALLHPEKVERLCVVDMSPVASGRVGDFTQYSEAMLGLDLDALSSRGEANAALEPAVPDPGIRGFLLQNLHRTGDTWTWQPNLEVLDRDMADLGDWPADQLSGVAPYEGRTLWVAGADSPYVRPEHGPEMDRWFPRNRLVTIKGAGHWVHSQQPDVFVDVLRQFLAGPV